MTRLLSIGDLQECIGILYKRRVYDASPQTLVLGAMEELGELSQAILLTECDDFTPSKKKFTSAYDDARDVSREVGDVITYLLALCNKLDIQPMFKWYGDAHD